MRAPDASGRARAARVLIAHESAAICEAIRRLVEHAGCVAMAVGDGRAALERLAIEPADVMVVDVAIPGIFVHRLCETVRARGLPTRVILIASVYEKTAYKRRPSSLYGADDYVEQHHIPDMLLPKIARLVPGAEVRAATSVDPDEAKAIQVAGEGRLRLRYGSPEEGSRGARRLAELIVADIALYHGEEFVTALERGEAHGQIARDLDEGRLLLAEHVPVDLREGGDLIGEALEALRLAHHRSREETRGADRTETGARK